MCFALAIYSQSKTIKYFTLFESVDEVWPAGVINYVSFAVNYDFLRIFEMSLFTLTFKVVGVSTTYELKEVKNNTFESIKLQ